MLMVLRFRSCLPLLTLLLVLLGTGCQTRPSQPQALYEAKQAVINWHDSGAYEAAVSVTIAKAEKLLNQTLPGSTRPAMVLDVDDTAITTWAYQRKSDFGYSTCDLKTFQEAATAPAIAPVLALYRHALARGVTVFFITGRRETLRSATEANLRFAGYEGYAKLFCKPTDWKADNAKFKTGIRQALQDEGYDVILNLGDQESDLVGGLARHGMRLPNPYYLSK
jgi:predicted secreted acid phosphatase